MTQCLGPARGNVTLAVAGSLRQELDSSDDAGLPSLRHRARWCGCGQLKGERDHGYNCGHRQIAQLLHRDGCLSESQAHCQMTDTRQEQKRVVLLFRDAAYLRLSQLAKRNV